MVKKLKVPGGPERLLSQGIVRTVLSFCFLCVFGRKAATCFCWKGFGKIFALPVTLRAPAASPDQ